MSLVCLKPRVPSRSFLTGRVLRIASRLLVACYLLPACTGGLALRGTPTLYAQSLDSASSSCRTWPTLCTHVAGEETVVPGVASRQAEQAVSLYAAAKLLTAFLGEEAHKLAFACITTELSALRPSGFSIEPRYRNTAQTGQLELITPQQEEALLAEGCHEDLRGTIKPDVVIHAGDPLRPQAVYDMKFPCVRNTDARWCKYAHGPHKGLNQRDVYRDLLGVPPHQVLPWIGVIP